MTDFLTAQQANALVQEANSLQGEVAKLKTSVILKSVEKAAKEGKRQVYVNAVDAIVKGHLEQLGYKVSTSYDQRDGDFTTISW